MSTTKRNSKGEGSVFKISTGRWRAKYPACPENNFKEKSFSATTRAEVTKKLNEYKKNLHIGLCTGEDIFFDEYIKNWLYNIKINEIKPSSFDRMESTVNTHLIPYLKNYKFNEITPELIQKNIFDRMQHMQDSKTGETYSLSYSSIKKAHDILNECFTYALLRKHVVSNPVQLTSLPRRDSLSEKEIIFFNDDEIRRFKEACLSKYSNGEYRYSYGLVFLIMLYTGLRSGEALNVSLKNDINFDQKSLYVRGTVVRHRDRSRQRYVEDGNDNLPYVTVNQKTAKTKSSTNREIQLGKTALLYLEMLKEKYINEFGELPEYLVSKDLTSSIGMSTFKKSFDKIVERADIKPCGLHTLRHTFASMLFRKGVDVKVVSEILGHANTTVTYNTYIHIIKEQKSAAIELLDEI